MLTYHLKPYDQQPLYEQLYHAVRADIMSGALPGGTRLPSKRKLAANLRVSQITVETAYGQLAAEGYIASAPRRGYFVQEQLAVPVSEPQEPFTPPLSPIFASEETYPYDFRTDFVDNGCFPFSTWARLSRSRVRCSVRPIHAARRNFERRSCATCTTSAASMSRRTTS